MNSVVEIRIEYDGYGWWAVYRGNAREPIFRMATKAEAERMAGIYDKHKDVRAK